MILLLTGVRLESPTYVVTVVTRNARCLLLATLILGRTAVAQTAASPSPDQVAILHFLEQTTAWYHQLDLQRQLVTAPEDVVLVNENQQLADQSVRLAFEFARTEAASLEQEAGPGQAGKGTTGSQRYQSLQRMAAVVDKQIKETRAEVESLRQKVAVATGRQRQALQTQLAETQSELELAEVRRDSLRSMVEFVGGTSASGLGATGLRGEIEALARSVPVPLAGTTVKKEGTASASEPAYVPPAAVAHKPAPSGIWALATDLFALSRKTRTFEDSLQQTASLVETARKLRTPLVTRLREMSKRGDELAKAADSADSRMLAQQKKELDELTSEFKQISTAMLPLSKLAILLQLYSKNLTDWQSTIKSQYREELRNLLVRLLSLIVLLALVIGGAQLWRRTIFRYVRDPRRRYQFLLMRKIVLWFAIAIILVSAFANELGSVATFAGLMTAGVAVALQNVLLSVAGYFFLIGKFGIRVGDRVQVAGVTGEVVDIGIVRFHLLELVSGGGKTPTGRVVAFSNSIVFQPAAGLFKQIPGTDFVWHEITLTMSPETDYGSVEERLRGAVEGIYSGYREAMERQHRELEKTLTAVGALSPATRLRLTPAGLEVVIRYPVDLHHAADIDDQITRGLLKAIESEPRLKLAGTTSTGIKLRTDLSTQDTARS